MRTKMSKVAKIRKMLDEGYSVKDITKKLGVTANYVYSTRWHMSKDKTKTAPKKAAKKVAKKANQALAVELKKLDEEIATADAAEVALNGNPLDTQVGGNHYRFMEIQPIQYITANDLGFLEGCIVKRISCWRYKGDQGIEDLEKIKHEVDLLIAAEKGTLQDVARA